jgi:hypothetical protein
LAATEPAAGWRNPAAHLPERGPGPARSAVRRFLREPLLHFLVLGALLFVVHGAVNRGSAQAGASQIALTLEDLRQLQIGFASKWERLPSPQEMAALVDDRVREEVLYREALALGLDKNDTIVRRRLAQKMEFLAEDVSQAREPSHAELEAWFGKNAQTFIQPGRVTFRHLYFSPDRRHERARDDAAKALARLANRPEDWTGAPGLADPFMFQDYMADRTPDQIARDFGPPFAKALFEAKPGAWTGPLESGYGWHVVFVSSSTPGRVPAFEEVEDEVRSAWTAEQHAESLRGSYAKLRAKYELVLPAPPQASKP